MHANKGKSIVHSLKDRIDYILNPVKTDGGRLVSSFGCSPQTAAAEFLISKKLYYQFTGKEQKDDVIAYQVRQAFKPGEVTPEEANKIGYEFATRFLKGKHAFVVATHIDRHHVHNHIEWNSTTLDGKSKFRDFLGSGRAVARLSDMICVEHQLSVIENPKRGNHSYNKWLGNRAKLSHRELLRLVIDNAILKQPSSFDELLRLIEENGYAIKQGKFITFSHPDFKRAIRLDSLGIEYTEKTLCAVLTGEKYHIPCKTQRILKYRKTSLLIDIQKKLEEGKGEGYRQWASVYNLKQMAKTVLFLQEHDFADLDALNTEVEKISSECKELTAKILELEKQIVEADTLRTHVINYHQTRELFQKYKESRYSPKFYEKHENDIVLHRAAKEHFNELELKRLLSPTQLKHQFYDLSSQKRELYSKLNIRKAEIKDYLLHQKNITDILNLEKNPEQFPMHSR